MLLIAMAHDDYRSHDFYGYTMPIVRRCLKTPSRGYYLN